MASDRPVSSQRPALWITGLCTVILRVFSEHPLSNSKLRSTADVWVTAGALESSKNKMSPEHHRIVAVMLIFWCPSVFLVWHLRSLTPAIMHGLVRGFKHLSPACWRCLIIFTEICMPCYVIQLFLVFISRSFSLRTWLKEEWDKKYIVHNLWDIEEKKLSLLLSRHHCVLEAFPPAPGWIQCPSLSFYNLVNLSVILCATLFSVSTYEPVSLTSLRDLVAETVFLILCLAQCLVHPKDSVCWMNEWI